MLESPMKVFNLIKKTFIALAIGALLVVLIPVMIPIVIVMTIKSNVSLRRFRSR